MLALSIMPVCAWGASDAAVSGIVRDGHGTPQMGALVELMGSDATVIARAFTDDHGRYLLPSVVPGSYQLRVSAAFLMPVVRGNVHLRAGVRAVADLTMTALFEAGAWLPAQRRSVNEPVDDWQWTLRSTANRPLLRLVTNGASPNATVGVSSSADRTRTVASDGAVVFLAGDGSFGQGGTHQIISLDHMGIGGDVSVLRASLRNDSSGNAGTSFVVAAGVERQKPFGGGTRVFVSVASHPELQGAAGDGLESLQVATTDKITLGDAFIVDAGTLSTAERLLGTRFNSAPYVRLAFRPSSEVTLEYRLATDRNLQRTEDLDTAALHDESLSDVQGNPILRRKLHQEIVATDDDPRHSFSVAVFHDVLPVASVQGGGLTGTEDLHGLAQITDPSTGTMRLALQGYSSNGLRVSWTQNFSPSILACVSGEFGRALAADAPEVSTDHLDSALRARTAGALSASVQTQAKRTGTLVNIHYRWQPERTVTQVNEFDAPVSEAYLGLSLKQRLWSGGRLKRVSAVVEATNLLAQGYEPLLSPDGQTLYLAQVPRGVLGGLAFSF